MQSADTLAADAAPNLAVLDARRRIEAPDASVFEANLAALRIVDPELAAGLAGVELPEHWAVVEALDGTPVWRIEPPGHPPAWLGGSAAPRVRADAVLARVRCDDRNPALPSAGCGWEILWLFERLPVSGAVYVFESDPQTLAAVLRLVPLADAIRSGRCRFVPHDDPDRLVGLLEREPGLLAPGRIVTLPSVPRERLMQIERLCSQVMDRMTELRNRRIEQICERFAARPPAAPPRRLLITALTPDAPPHRLATELAEARPAGVVLAASVCDRPQQAHLLAHLIAAEAFDPDAVLAVGHDPRRLSEPLHRPGLWWHTSLPEATQVDPDAAALHLPASPTIAAALREAGVANERIAPLYWAVSPAWLEQTAPLATRPIDPRRVWLLGDLPHDDPQRFGITHTTHKRLWQALHRVAERVWSEPTVLEAGAILRLASDRCDVHVRDEQIRSSFLRLIRLAVVPRAVRLALLRLARQAGCRVTAIGSGWDAVESVRHEPDVPRAVASLLQDETAPRPVVLHGSLPEPLTRPLVQLAAAGLPLLLYAPQRRWLADQLGGVLDPQRNVQTFEHARGLLRQLERGADDGPDQAQRLRDKLAGCTWSHRLAALLADSRFVRP